jgi:hypothetical protein
MAVALRAFDVTHRLDDQTVAHAHQIHAAHRIGLALTEEKRQRMIARSLITTTSSSSKCVPAAVAICVHCATHSSRPTHRAPLGAGVVFSIMQSAVTNSGKALGSWRRNTSLKRRITSAV